MLIYVFFYLLIINALGFMVMLIDKYKARKRRWRIPEDVFFAIALVGGCPGCIAGMYLVRHKTQHKSFTLGMPLILFGQLLLIWLLRH